VPDVYRFELSIDHGESVEADNYYDLLADALGVGMGSWRETPHGDRIVATCTLFKADDAADIRTAVNQLRDFLNMAVEYAADNTNPYSLWYRWQTTGEGLKRALVFSYALEPIDHDVDDIHLESGAGRYLFTFTRAAAYEEREPQQATRNNISTVGGMWDLSGTIIGGDTDGRIRVLKVTPRSASSNLAKMWVGIRPLRAGIGASGTSFFFNPTLDLKTQHSLGVTGVSNSTSESNTVDGQHMSDDFSGGTDLAFKFSYSLSSSVGAFVGRYLVLLRCKITSGSGVCLARISTSFTSPTYSAPVALGATQYLTNAAWKLIELGEVEIPGSRGHSALDLQTFRLNLETGRASGTAVLGADSIILIPSDHYITWDGATFGKSGSPDTEAWIMTHPDNGVDGYVAGAPTGESGTTKEGQAYGYGELGGRNWAYPRNRIALGNGGVLVLAAERSDGTQDAAESVDLEIEVKRRWQSYRT
jgi:hypothetical protein